MPSEQTVLGVLNRGGELELLGDEGSAKVGTVGESEHFNHELAHEVEGGVFRGDPVLFEHVVAANHDHDVGDESQRESNLEDPKHKGELKAQEFDPQHVSDEVEHPRKGQPDPQYQVEDVADLPAPLVDLYPRPFLLCEGPVVGERSRVHQEPLNIGQKHLIVLRVASHFARLLLDVAFDWVARAVVWHAQG